MLEDRLTLGRRIASGGMAEVFHGRLRGAEGFRREIAVKRVQPRFARDPDFRARFVHEARLAAGLRHPSIGQVYELIAEGDELWMLMELVDGIDLRALLKHLRGMGRLLPRAAALKIMADLADALACAHEQVDRDGRSRGIVHRDVSPSNVLVGRRGEVKLIDFGIASAEDHVRFTSPGVVVGKVRYMSPEQAAGDPVDARTDLWACGVIFFELLAGVHPFAGDTNDVLGAILANQRLDLRRFPGVSEAEAELVDHCLAYARDERIPSARELARALDGLWAGSTPRQGQEELVSVVDVVAPPVPAEPTLVRADGGLRTQSAHDGQIASTVVGAAVPGPRSTMLLEPSLPIPSEPPQSVTEPSGTAPVPVEASSTRSTHPITAHRAHSQPRAALVVAAAILAVGMGAWVMSPWRAGDTLALPAGAGSAATSDSPKIPPSGETGELRPVHPDEDESGRAPRRVERSAEEPSTSAAGAVAADPVAADQVAEDLVAADLVAAGPVAAGPVAAGLVASRPVAGEPVAAPSDDAAADDAASGRDAGVAHTNTAQAAGDATRTSPMHGRPGRGTRRAQDAQSPPTPALPGTLAIDARPWAHLTIDGIARGPTPQRLELDAGRHVLVLENKDEGLARRIEVEIVSGETTSLRVPLR